MSDGASTNTTTTTTAAPNGVTPVVEGSESVSETLTRADVDQVIAAALAGVTKKLNGEIAALRKKQKAEAETVSPEKREAAQQAITQSDLKTIRELGRLESKVGDEALASLGEEYDSMPPAQQLMVLRVLAKAPKAETAAAPAAAKVAEEIVSSGDEAEKKPGRDVRAKPNPRAEAPQSRDPLPRPRTQTEYAALKKSNPKFWEQLTRDETFKPSELPFR